MARPGPERAQGRICAGCQGVGGTHAAGCVLGAVAAEHQALAAAVGLFVADVAERLDTLDRLLHGEP